MTVDYLVFWCKIETKYFLFCSATRYIPGGLAKEPTQHVAVEPFSKEIAIQCEVVKCGCCPCERPWMVDAETQCNLPEISLSGSRSTDNVTDFQAGKISIMVLCLFLHQTL